MQKNHAIILVTLTPVIVILMIMERNRHICVIESVVYYVDPKSPGSLCFLGSKERVRLPLHEEHCSVEALKKHTVAHAGPKPRNVVLQSNLSFVDWQRLPKEAKPSRSTHKHSGK